MTKILDDEKLKIPTNTRPTLVAGLLIIFGAVGGFGAWSAFAELSSAVIAQGTVKVDTNRKKVQTLSGGVVKQLRVRNGDKVAIGEVLVTLDETQAAASHKIMQSNMDTVRATIARLRAERDLLAEVPFPEDLLAKRDQGSVADILEGQEKLFAARRESFDGQVAMIRERVGQLGEEIIGVKAQAKSKQRQIEIIEDELAGLQELHKKGYAPKTRVLALEREAANLLGEKGEHVASIARTKRLISEAELEIIQTRKSFTESVVSELQQRESEFLDLSEKLNATAFMLGQTEIRATAKGTVVDLSVHTEGGVLQPGQTLLEIVPEDDHLIVEARVMTTDIDNIHPNMDAEVQFTAFSQRTTPKIKGTVAYVSADSLIDKDTGAPYFLARIAISEKEARFLGDELLLPGMPADVFILTGGTTPLEYLVKPIAETAAKAWREG